MRDYMIKRIVKEAEYTLKTQATVRKTAEVFHLGKSTVHKDLTERLYSLDKEVYRAVKKVLKINLEERHIRGGNATRRKFLRLKGE